MKSRMARLTLLSLLLPAVGQVTEANDSYVAPADAKINLQCQCVAGFSGCQLKIFDDAAGNQRHSWVQDAHVKKGTTYNLDELCYRKRDAQGQGDSMCCPGSSEQESIKRLFRGNPQ